MRDLEVALLTAATSALPLVCQSMESHRQIIATHIRNLCHCSRMCHKLDAKQVEHSQPIPGRPARTDLLKSGAFAQGARLSAAVLQLLQICPTTAVRLSVRKDGDHTRLPVRGMSLAHPTQRRAHMHPAPRLAGCRTHARVGNATSPSVQYAARSIHLCTAWRTAAVPASRMLFTGSQTHGKAGARGTMSYRTCTQCVSISIMRMPRLSWSVRLRTWSLVCSRSTALCGEHTSGGHSDPNVSRTLQAALRPQVGEPHYTPVEACTV